MKDGAVRAIAIALGVGGLANLATAVHTGPSHGQAASTAWLAAVLDGGHLSRRHAIILGLLLVVLAWGVAGRRRLAHRLVLGLLAVVVVVAAPEHPARGLVPAALAAGLVMLWGEFTTGPDARRIRFAGWVALGVVAAALAGGGWQLHADHEHPGRAVLVGLSMAPAPARSYGYALALAVAGGTALALLVALAPAPAPGPGDPAERAQVAALTRHPDAGSLAPFATRGDRTYVFSPDARAAIGYRVLFGTALAGGDPVGAADAAPAAIAAFVATCTRHGWRPAVLGADEAATAHWRAHGLRGLVFGDEAVLDAEAFGLASRRMRNVRQAVQRSRNAGVTVTVGPLDAALARELRPVLDDWLRGRAERGFAMNLDHVLHPRSDCLVAVARDRYGRAQAFARFAVCAAGGTYTLDVAPRRRGAPNGVVERLIIDTVAHARAHGAREVSLNFAGFRRLYAATDTGARALAVVLHAFDRWIELGPLYRFTAKFHPGWRPRRLLVRSWFHLGWVGLAALAAEFGRTPSAPAGDLGGVEVPSPVE